MDEDISYAGDIPYETQLPDQEGHSESSSLKQRIGNRIYLLEDSMSKKRKLVDLERAGNEGDHEEEGDEEDTDSSHRPNALLLQGLPISQLPTARVFAYATHFDAHPIGLEWVDDQTCVLVFASRKTASQAWDALRRASQSEMLVTDQVEGMLEEAYAFYPALPLPLALYPIEERINSVLGNTKSNALKEPIRIRWARSDDVKKPGARVESEFYKRHGEMAGKEGLPRFTQSIDRDQVRNGNKRQRRDGDDDEETRRQLDAELDNFLDEEGPSSPENPEPRVRRRGGEVSQPAGRARNEEEKRRALDSELDSFLAREDDTLSEDVAIPLDIVSGEPSLLDRTAQSIFRSQSPRRHDRPSKSLPRRSRRGGPDTYGTAGEGRWLHNAEVKQGRRRGARDEGGSRMRAWAGDESHYPKLRKTQEELDQELERFTRDED